MFQYPAWVLLPDGAFEIFHNDIAPCIMLTETQGETENQVLKFCTDNGIEGAAAKPGLITDGLAKKAFAATLWLTMGVPSIEIGKCARAILDQVVNGFEKEPLMNDDLIKIAEEVERKG